MQLATVKINHHSQGLSLDELVFDPTNIKKHGLTHITLSHIQTKEKIFLLTPFQHDNSYVDLRIHVEMNRLKKIVNWIPIITQLKKLHNFHVIIKTLNTTSFHQHYKNINHDHNFQMFHILCFIETTIHHASIDVHTFINSLK
jgi:hypothetical protein